MSIFMGSKNFIRFIQVNSNLLFLLLLFFKDIQVIIKQKHLKSEAKFALLVNLCFSKFLFKRNKALLFEIVQAFCFFNIGTLFLYFRLLILTLKSKI